MEMEKTPSYCPLAIEEAPKTLNEPKLILVGKSLLNPPPFILGLLHPPTMKPSVLLHELSKTVYFTPGRFCHSNSGFATVPVGLLQ